MNLNEESLTSRCDSFHDSIELIGKRWTGVLIAAMLAGANRACDIKEAITGISDRLLTERLRELEDAGIVARQVTDARPPAVLYSLTDKGEALAPIIEQIRTWGKTWAKDTQVNR